MLVVAAKLWPASIVEPSKAILLVLKRDVLMSSSVNQIFFFCVMEWPPLSYIGM